jgi:hypothetical protein
MANNIPMAKKKLEPSFICSSFRTHLFLTRLANELLVVSVVAGLIVILT